jgi:hypothetical protein
VSIDSALALAKRLKRERQARDLSPVILIIGCPEACRLFPDRMTSEREAVIGVDYFAALDDETTKAFHTRLCRVARERGVRIVSVGSDEPVKESRYNLDGSPITVN